MLVFALISALPAPSIKDAYRTSGCCLSTGCDVALLGNTTYSCRTLREVHNGCCGCDVPPPLEVIHRECDRFDYSRMGRQMNLSIHTPDLTTFVSAVRDEVLVGAYSDGLVRLYMVRSKNGTFEAGYHDNGEGLWAAISSYIDHYYPSTEKNYMVPDPYYAGTNFYYGIDVYTSNGIEGYRKQTFAYASKQPFYDEFGAQDSTDTNIPFDYLETMWITRNDDWVFQYSNPGTLSSDQYPPEDQEALVQQFGSLAVFDLYTSQASQAALYFIQPHHSLIRSVHPDTMFTRTWTRENAPGVDFICQVTGNACY